MKKKWYVRFDEGGGEYTGHLSITAENVRRAEDDEKILYADGVCIEIDEPILSIEELGEINAEQTQALDAGTPCAECGTLLPKVAGKCGNCGTPRK